MIGQAPKSAITGVPGWETADEQAFLLRLAQNVPADGRIVEIGGEWGMSASLFCKGALPDVKITTVDVFPGDMLVGHRANLVEAGYVNRSEQIQGDSTAVGKQWDRGAIDLLFIDGDHAYEGVKRDIDAWVRFVPVGGIVAFHDCACVTNKLPHALHFEVTRAVSEWYWGTKGKWRALTSVDTILSFERVK